MKINIIEPANKGHNDFPERDAFTVRKTLKSI